MQIQSVSLHRAAYRPEDFARDGRQQFAIIGRSNVGKSSLINAILRRKDIARVSQTPGKTQAIHFYLINDRFYIVDLPGYGYAKVSKAMSSQWGELVRQYFEGAEELSTTFLLLDSRREPTEHDLMMVDWMRQSGSPFRVVLTKVDKLTRNQRATNHRNIAATLHVNPDDLLSFSKTTGEGVEEIWREVLPHIEAKRNREPSVRSR